MKTINFLILLPILLSGCNDGKNKMNMVETNGAITLKTVGYARVNGLKMYYEIHGTGQPLVLMHGGGSTIHASPFYLVATEIILEKLPLNKTVSM